MTNTTLPVIVVTAAIIERRGEFLVTRRPHGVHLAGLWEFPGGKCEPGESHDACLRREIIEELGADVRVVSEVFQVRHAYDDRIIELHFFSCDLLEEPRAVMGQEMRWVSGEGLCELDFPPADRELIELLRDTS